MEDKGTNCLRLSLNIQRQTVTSLRVANCRRRGIQTLHPRNHISTEARIKTRQQSRNCDVWVSIEGVGGTSRLLSNFTTELPANTIVIGWSTKCGIIGLGTVRCRLQLKCDGTRWITGGEPKWKLANGVGSQYPSHYLGTWCIQHYYRWCAHLGCQ